MRQMARDRQHQVMMRGCHHLDIGAERCQNAAQPLHRLRRSPARRRQDAPAILTNSSAKPGVGPGMLGAGDRMRRE